LTFGPSMVEQIVERSALPVDAHLMIDEADTEAPAYAEAGAASVTFHLEAAHAPVKLARDLRRKNTQAGVALRPATAVEPLLDIIGEFDMLLIMTVEPGFGGQSFLETMLPKIRRARAAISEANLEVSIQVDGGVSRETIERSAEAGASVCVAGSAIYRAQDAADEISALRELAQRHTAHCHPPCEHPGRDRMDLLQWLFSARIEFEGGQFLLLREVLGNVFGLLSALGGMRRKIWAWPVGIAGNLLLLTVFLGTVFGSPNPVDLYGQAGRQVMFIATAVYGWIRWHQARDQDGTAVEPRWASWGTRALLGVVLVGGTAALTPVFRALG